jgi:hypothetical protein
MKKIIIILLLAVLYLTVLTCKSINDNGKRLTPKNKHSRLQKMKKPIPVVGVDSMSSNVDQDTAVLEYVGGIIAESRMSYVKMKDYKNATYVDNSESIKPIKNLIKGLIAYSVPDEMTVGENYNVKIRITKDSTQKKMLVIGDNKIPINDTTVQSTITIESIRVSSIMSASLTTDSEENFKIASKSTETQNIEQLGYTEWEWNVIPLKSGEHELKLIIKVRITSEDGEKSFKDIVVFEKNIFAKKNVSYSIKNLFNKYWQWSLSTLIIPFIVWLYNRKKKKKEE